MNAIEKLYELVGISREPIVIPSSGETIDYGDYPSFTAEKQIMLIKWLIKNYHFTLGEDNETLEQTLYYVMLDIWQYLTPEEQTEIRKILEG